MWNIRYTSHWVHVRRSLYRSLLTKVLPSYYIVSLWATETAKGGTRRSANSHLVLVGDTSYDATQDIPGEWQTYVRKYTHTYIPNNNKIHAYMKTQYSTANSHFESWLHIAHWNHEHDFRNGIVKSHVNSKGLKHTRLHHSNTESPERLQCAMRY